MEIRIYARRVGDVDALRRRRRGTERNVKTH